MMEKIPHTIDKYTFCWKYGFGIGYGTGQKYPPIWVAVSVSNLDQNRGFGRTLCRAVFSFSNPGVFVVMAKL